MTRSLLARTRLRRADHRRLRLALVIALAMLLVGGGRNAGAAPGDPDARFRGGICTGTANRGFSPTVFAGSPPTPVSCPDQEPVQNQSHGRAVGVQFVGPRPQGYKVVVAGWMEAHNPVPGVHGFALTRYHYDGAQDLGFGGGDGKVTEFFHRPAKAHDLLVRPDESLVVVGDDGVELLLAGYDANGTSVWQSQPGVPASEGARAIALAGAGAQSDLLVVATDASNGPDEIHVARLDAHGALLPAFGSGGIANFSNNSLGTSGLHYRAFHIAWDASVSAIFVAGEVEDPTSGERHFLVLQLEADGRLRGVFGGTSALVPVPGVQTVAFPAAAAAARRLARGPNGDLYVGGSVESAAGSAFALARLSRKLGKILGRATGGPPDALGHAMVMDSRNRITLVGEAPGAPPQQTRIALMRFTEDLQPDTDFGPFGTGWQLSAATPGPSRAFDAVLPAKYQDELVLAADSVPDSSSIPTPPDNSVTNWWQTAARFEAGPVCGDGRLDRGEQCEAPFQECCTTWCTFVPAGSACTDDGEECTVDQCDGSGVCAHSPLADGTACADDGLFCTGAEKCEAGRCQSAGNPCAGGGECADSCNESTNTCFEAQGTPCSPDGKECTDDVCNGSGACAHPNRQVGTACGSSSSTKCTAPDTCNASGQCEANHEVDGTHCGDDGTECTNQDYCRNGQCADQGFVGVGTPAPVFCADLEPCNLDLCNGAGGCVHSSDPAADVDGDGDPDNDDDGVCDNNDNCMNTCNPDQLDSDGGACLPTGGDLYCGATDGGDVCDPCPALNTQSPLHASPGNPACVLGTAPPAPFEPTSVAASFGPSGTRSCNQPGSSMITPDGRLAIHVRPNSLPVDRTLSITGVGGLGRRPPPGREIFIRTGGGVPIAAMFEPEGLNFTPNPIVLTFAWRDDDGNGIVDAYPPTSPPTNSAGRYKVRKLNIREKADPLDPNGSERIIMPQCQRVACSLIDPMTGIPAESPGPGQPDGWGPSAVYDPVLGLRSCCDQTRNKAFVELVHFSAYGIGEIPCAPIERSKVVLSKLDGPAGKHRLQISGEFTLDFPFAPAIDPVESGARLSLRSDRGSAVAVASIPPGAWDRQTGEGWRANASGTSFTWKSKKGVDGISKVLLKLGNRKSPGKVKFKVVGRTGDYLADPELLPYGLEFSLDQIDDATSNCGRITYADEEGDCQVFSGSLRCR